MRPGTSAERGHPEGEDMWVKKNKLHTEQPHTCELPVTDEAPTYDVGDVWECTECSSLYKATPVGNAVTLVRMSRLGSVVFRMMYRR